MPVLQLIAAALLGVLGWGIFVFFSPYRACLWCRHKTGRNPPCWRCNRTRLTRRIGAYHVHKVKLSLIQAWEEREFWR